MHPDNEDRFRSEAPSAANAEDSLNSIARSMGDLRDALLDLAEKAAYLTQEVVDGLVTAEQWASDAIFPTWQHYQDAIAEASAKERGECDLEHFGKSLPTHFDDATVATVQAMIAKRNRRPVPTKPATLQKNGTDL